MRQGQQNRRGRGRNTNNRKGQNPLSRSFESNGPDVKIRGTPAHIAEKYISLARDAQTSGDPVLAENYTQHAEHYNRIIMAYRDQLQQPGDMANGNGQRIPVPGEGGDDFRDDDTEDILDENYQQSQLQPPQQRVAYEGNRNDGPRHEGNRNDGPRNEGNRNDGPRHEGNRNDGPRHDRPFRRDQGRHRDRYSNDRNNRDRPPNEPRPPQVAERQEGPGGNEGGNNDPRRRDRLPPPHEQPEFLRRPVRRARSESDEAAPPPKDEPSSD